MRAQFRWVIAHLRATAARRTAGVVLVALLLSGAVIVYRAAPEFLAAPPAAAGPRPSLPHVSPSATSTGSAAGTSSTSSSIQPSSALHRRLSWRLQSRSAPRPPARARQRQRQSAPLSGQAFRIDRTPARESPNRASSSPPVRRPTAASMFPSWCCSPIHRPRCRSDRRRSARQAPTSVPVHRWPRRFK